MRHHRSRTHGRLVHVQAGRLTASRSAATWSQDGDVELEVERLVGLGASRADVGQTGEEGFTVLADPEGNEFCVLHRDQR